MAASFYNALVGSVHQPHPRRRIPHLTAGLPTRPSHQAPHLNPGPFGSAMTSPPGALARPNGSPEPRLVHDDRFRHQHDNSIQQRYPLRGAAFNGGVFGGYWGIGTNGFSLYEELCYPSAPRPRHHTPGRLALDQELVRRQFLLNLMGGGWLVRAAFVNNTNSAFAPRKVYFTDYGLHCPNGLKPSPMQMARPNPSTLRGSMYSWTSRRVPASDQRLRRRGH